MTSFVEFAVFRYVICMLFSSLPSAEYKKTCDLFQQKNGLYGNQADIKAAKMQNQ